MLIPTDKGTRFKSLPFASEKELQDQIEAHPGVLDVLSTINKQDTSLLIIGREFAVQSGSIDFLATDAEGTVYIVETKLAANPELRRAVIGQVLEYASNLRDMPYEVFEAQCSDYCQRPLAHALTDFYRNQANDDDAARGPGEYEWGPQRGLEQAQFNIVVVTDAINFEIQRLFNYIDEVTSDNLNFIVLEINKYQVEGKTYLHSNVAWAAKYIRSLFSRRVLREQDYLASLLPPIRELVAFIDRWCTAQGLSKTATTKGLSWKNDAGAGGSVHVAVDHIATNWATIRVHDDAFGELKRITMRRANEAGFELIGGKTGGFRARFDDLLRLDAAEVFLSLANNVMKEANRLASAGGEK